MQIVKTRDGKEWTLDLTAGTARRWKAKGLVDLLDSKDVKQIVEFEMDSLKRMDAYFELCKGQNGIDSDDDFFENLNAEDMLAFDNALSEEIELFTQGFQMAIPLKAMRAKMQNLRTTTMNKAAGMVNAMGPKLEQTIDQELAKMMKEFEEGLPGSTEDGETTTDSADRRVSPTPTIGHPEES